MRGSTVDKDFVEKTRRRGGPCGDVAQYEDTCPRKPYHSSGIVVWEEDDSNQITVVCGTHCVVVDV